MTLPSFAHAGRAHFAFVAAALLAAGLPAHAADTGAALQPIGLTGVQGSGKLQTEARNVGSFQAIEVHASMNVVLRQGAREAVELRADDNLLALVETRAISRSGVPTLKIAVAGSGNVKLQRLNLDEASLKISGSGNAELAGKAGRLGLSISGSGDSNTRELEADEVSVSIAGSGDAKVNARKTLSVSIAGSGRVKKR